MTNEKNDVPANEIDEIYKKLIGPFPDDSYKVDLSRWNSKENKGIKLTSITAQCIKERLNEIFTPFGWTITGEYKGNEKGVLFFGKLSVMYKPDVWHHIEGVGYAVVRNNIGDAYKSANTDCLSKCASNLGIGNDVFKGKIDPDTITKRQYNNKNASANRSRNRQPQSRPSFSTGMAIEQQKQAIRAIAKRKNMNVEESLKDMTYDEASDFIKRNGV